MNTPTLEAVLVEALDDEYKAQATYRAVIQTFGPVRPFANIVEAEGRHVQALLPLFERYRIPLPGNRWEGRIAAPASLAEAARMGVQAEIDNAAMYDRLLAASAGYPDVQRVLGNLQRASQFNHLPAFRRATEALSAQNEGWRGSGETPGAVTGEAGHRGPRGGGGGRGNGGGCGAPDRGGNHGAGLGRGGCGGHGNGWGRR